MANCIHANPCRLRPSIYLPNLSISDRRLPRAPSFLPFANGNLSSASQLKIGTNGSLKLRRRDETLVKFQRSSTMVCLLGGKDKSDKDNEGSPWKSFDKAIGGLKGQSIEDVLRQQIEKQEFYNEGSGKNPPRGGSGRGGGDGSGESEDGGISGVLDETLQVVLATFGFVFLYVYIITGEELTLLAKDYIKYLFKGSKSFRLKRNMYMWKRLFKKLTEKKVVERDPMWLERAIINTPTWFDSPEKYRQIVKSHLASNSDQ